MSEKPKHDAESMEFAAALDEFFDVAFAKAAEGKVPYSWIEDRIADVRRFTPTAPPKTTA